MTYDNTRSLLTEISHHYFFSFIKGPMRLKAFSARCGEIILFVRPLKDANFHREYYPNCVASCNECTRPTVFLLT